MSGLEDYSIYPTPQDLPQALQRYCMEAGDSGIYIFHHRFCVCPFPLAFPVTLRDLLSKRESDAMAALATGKTLSYLLHHEKPYRPEVLIDLLHDGYFSDTPAQYWELVRHVWVNIDLPEDSPYWAEMLAANIGNNQDMMCEIDREDLARMPDRIRIWRGVEGSDEASAREAVTAGHSWSISADIAARFAKSFARSSGEGWLASLLVPKTQVVAYLTNRGEAEIILHPRDVSDLDIKLISLGTKAAGFSGSEDKLCTSQTPEAP